MFVGLPIWGIYTFWQWLYAVPKHRPERTGGSASSVLGGAMLEIDKVTRPPVEHVIESQSQIIDQDEHDGHDVYSRCARRAVVVHFLILAGSQLTLQSC